MPKRSSNSKDSNSCLPTFGSSRKRSKCSRCTKRRNRSRCPCRLAKSTAKNTLSTVKRDPLAGDEAVVAEAVAASRTGLKEAEVGAATISLRQSSCMLRRIPG